MFALLTCVKKIVRGKFKEKKGCPGILYFLWVKQILMHSSVTYLKEKRIGQTPPPQKKSFEIKVIIRKDIRKNRIPPPPKKKILYMPLI